MHKRKTDFEAKYSERIKALHKNKIYSTFFTYDASNNFAYSPVRPELALQGFEDILVKENFRVKRRILHNIQASSHISVVMPREQEKLKAEHLKACEMKNGRPWKIKFQITGCTLFSSKKTNKLQAALIVESLDIHKIREQDLMIERTADFKTHITLGESV